MGRDVEKTRAKSVWIGRTLVGFAFADDGKWDWTSDNGDKHMDLAAIAITQREGYPRALRLSLGPIMILIARGERQP